MIFVKPRFFHGRADVSHDSYDETSRHITLENLVLEKLQKVFANIASAAAKANAFSVRFAKGEGPSFLFGQILLLFHLKTLQNDAMCAGVFVKKLSLASPVDKDEYVLN